MYADILFKLGNVWQANDVIAPLATTWSSNIDDVNLGARLAYLVGDYDRAEKLFQRLRAITTEVTQAYMDALRGLVLVYYQTDSYEKVHDINPPNEEDIEGSSLLTFMKRFEGMPNQVEWATGEKIAHLPMINDYTQPGELPLFRLKVNGYPVEFILDTGGDRMYIDEGVAEKIGIRHIHKRQSKYAYTGGEYVDEPLGVAEMVVMGDVALKNVPVVVAKWKAMGPTSDGVITTQMFKKFLSKVDYDEGRITFFERSKQGRQQLLETLDGVPLVMPFWMSGTHLMYTKGSLNGHKGMNLFMDSGLASSMELIILNETVEFLSLEKNDIDGSKYYWSAVESHGIGPLVCKGGQALGNVIVEENVYSGNGFIFDALISHQYLHHFGSWTIDFDNMCYYFPADSEQRARETYSGEQEELVEETGIFKLTNPDEFVGSYEVAPGVALEISTDEGVVFFQAPGQQKVSMEAVAKDLFLIRLAGAKITFERDNSGAISALVLDQAGNQTRAKRK